MSIRHPCVAASLSSSTALCIDPARGRFFASHPIAFTSVVVSMVVAAPPVSATDYFAVQSGNWSATSTWDGDGGPPQSGDGAYIYNGTFTVTMTADVLNLVTFNIGNNGTLDLNGHNISTTGDFNLWGFGPGSVARTGGGTITAGEKLWLKEGSSLSLAAGDRCKVFEIYSGGTASFAATANATHQVLVYGSTMNMNAPIDVLEAVGVGGDTGVLNMNGHDVKAPDINIWGNGSGSVTRVGGGSLIAANMLKVAEGSSLAMVAGDRCKYFEIHGGGTASLAATANVTHQVWVVGSTMNMNADIDVAESVWVGGNTGVLNMNGHDVTAPDINIWGFGSGTTDGTGRVFCDNLVVAESSLGKVAGGTVATKIDIGNADTLRVMQGPNQLTGLSFEGSTLTLGSAGLLDLQFDTQPAAGLDWTFRWLGNRVSTLQSLAAANKLIWNSPAGATPSIFYQSSDDYTYVGYVSAVPEPATLGLVAAGGLAALLARRHRRG